MSVVNLCVALLALAPQGAAASDDFAKLGDNAWLERNHTTGNIRALDTKVEWVFIETAHFRLACALTPTKPPAESDAKRRLEVEFRELKARRIDVPRGKLLDAKTRALLYALRCERLYDDLRRRLGVADADFAIHTDKRRPSEYLGEGPYLGMPNKFLVMLCAHESTLQKYVQAFANRRDARGGLRHSFLAPAALFYGMAEDCVDGRFADDTYLHAATVYSLVHTLTDGFRYYWHESPFWLQEGLAHWYRRQVIDEFDHYSVLPIGLPERNRTQNWPATMRARVDLGNFTPLREAMAWIDDRAIDYGDHVAIWSRIDYLMRRHPNALGPLFKAVKGSSATSSVELLVERQIEGLAKSVNATPEQFDAAWVEFVRQTYPKK